MNKYKKQILFFTILYVVINSFLLLHLSFKINQKTYFYIENKNATIKEVDKILEKNTAKFNFSAINICNIYFHKKNLDSNILKDNFSCVDSKINLLSQEIKYKIKTSNNQIYLAANIPYGQVYGTIECAAVNLKVNLCWSTSQSDCDIWNRACVLPMCTPIGTTGTAIIGDHSSQEFSRIYNMPIGAKVYITTSYGEFIYEVASHSEGHNCVSYISDANGNNLFTGNYNGIILYTCNGCWQNVHLVYLKLINGTKLS